MAGAITLTEVDFEQIKLNLIEYLKSTKQFTDYDFSGSNLSVILDLISYQAQLNAYSTNMIANESFLASASIRNNVVANARTVGYVPLSAKSAQSVVTFSFEFTTTEFPNGYPSFVEIQPGMVFLSGTGVNNFVFNAIDPITAPIGTAGVCTFTSETFFEGTFLRALFVNDDGNFNQKFVLENTGIDTSTIRVEVQPIPTEDFTVNYEQANNLVEVSGTSNVYWIEETDEEHYELVFGDGFFGSKLKNGSKIHVTYVVSSGSRANGIDATNNFQYSGRIVTSDGQGITGTGTIDAASTTFGGAEIESIPSIKFNAPKSYGAQNRAVTASDYEVIIKNIYPPIADIYVYGGEELDIPEYGRIFAVIKPTTGLSLSNTTKNYIVESIQEYKVASTQLIIQDPQILYVEVDSLIYYNNRSTLKDSALIASEVRKTLSSYFIEGAIDKFGGAARFSRIVGAIDDSDPSITRNTTDLRMRKDFNIVPSTPASYEICFEQSFRVNPGGSATGNLATAVVYSSGFQLLINGVDTGRTYYFEDDSIGNLYLFYFDNQGEKIITDTSFGTVDYATGEIMLGYVEPITFISTVKPDDVIQIRALPFGQDVIAKKSVFLDLDIDSSRIDALVDAKLTSY